MRKMAASSKQKPSRELKAPVDQDFVDEDSGPEDQGPDKRTKPSNLRGDWLNIFILLVLYSLQGVPMGFASTIPLIMKERGVSYSAIGMFALSSWPFSLKLFWAPIVDSVYSEGVGRRKTWLLPTQIIIGVLLVLISFKFETWIAGDGSVGGAGGGPNGGVNIVALTGSFFALYFLCATQDIAVDGWALTILREE